MPNSSILGEDSTDTESENYECSYTHLRSESILILKTIESMGMLERILATFMRITIMLACMGTRNAQSLEGAGHLLKPLVQLQAGLGLQI